jgi:NADPH:quinone reductase-like Zn-dependent oxidoreductase
MKAVRLLEYGQLVFNDVPTPPIAPDEILVKIRSTAVNHLDEASGTARQILPIDLPRGYLVMSFQGSSNRLAVTLPHAR